jgi:hypothetical protein
LGEYLFGGVCTIAPRITDIVTVNLVGREEQRLRGRTLNQTLLIIIAVHGSKNRKNKKRARRRYRVATVREVRNSR